MRVRRATVVLVMALVGCGVEGRGEPPQSAQAVRPSADVRDEAPAEERAEPVETRDPSEAPDWERWARAADAWTDDGRREEIGGRGAVAVVRPIDLHPSECRSPQAPTGGIPTVRTRPTTVGPDPDYPYVLLRRVLRVRAPALDACAADCVEGTDLFEAWVGEDGSLGSLTARARTHGSDARTECLTRTLSRVTLPAPAVAPSHLVFAIRLPPR